LPEFCDLLGRNGTCHNGHYGEKEMVCHAGIVPCLHEQAQALPEQAGGRAAGWPESRAEQPP
jgi:hypothetical protein